MKAKVMRTMRVAIVLLLVGLLMVVSAGAGPLQQQPPPEVNWTKYYGNPVLRPGRAGSWDAYMVLEPGVIYDGGAYKMWYSGQDVSFGQPQVAHLSIGYATSSNGIDWTKETNNPVLVPGAAGDWDEENVAGAYVMLDEDIYKMWYHGGIGGIGPGQIEQIGYATSVDGVTWTKHPGNPILTVTPGTWEEQKVIDPCVIRQDSVYEMWYAGLGPDDRFRIGYATSPDGIGWTKPFTSPVMEGGSAGSFDSKGVRSPSVLFDGKLYRMWYTSIDLDGTYRLGYAVSDDGLEWTKYSGNPILEPGPTGSWDMNMAALAEVIYDGSAYRMWYTGQAIDRFRIGHALPNNTVLNPDTGKLYTTIQAGIEEALSGQQVIASGGQYVENITLIAGVTVYGSGADRTTLQGAGGGSVVTIQGGGIGPGTVISGFKITGGSASGGVSAQADGGGVHISGASPSIINNTIEGNTGTTGGGIYIDNGDPTISNTTIQNNSADSGGGIYVNSGNPTISNNTVQDNDASSGGGIYVNSGDSDISNNTVQGNDSNIGGGIYISSSNPGLSNNTIQGNTSTDNGGGIYINDGGPTISNNTVQNNNSNANGGGIYLGGGNSNISNNVIQSNSALAGGGIYVGSAATPAISDNTLCSNTNFNLYKNGGNLNAPGNWWGTNSPISGTTGTEDYNAHVNPGPIITAGVEAVPSMVKVSQWTTVTVTLRREVYHAADGTVIDLAVQDGLFWGNGASVAVSTTSGLVSTQVTPLAARPISITAFSGCSGQAVGSVVVTGERAEVNLPLIMKPASQ